MSSEPAFPVSTVDGMQGHQDSTNTWQFPGMSLRDYFAAKAMSFSIHSFEEMAGIAHQANQDHRDGFYVAAKFAYQIADAMLKAREA